MVALLGEKRRVCFLGGFSWEAAAGLIYAQRCGENSPPLQSILEEEEGEASLVPFICPSPVFHSSKRVLS